MDLNEHGQMNVWVERKTECVENCQDWNQSAG